MNYMHIAYVDVENANTKKVDTLQLKIIENNNENFIFDIASLTEEELQKLINAINKNLFYTDIEMFYIDDSSIPYFGPDYDFDIEDDKLKATLRIKK